MAAVIQSELPSDATDEVWYGESLQRYLKVLRQAICDAEKPQNQPHFFPLTENLENEISLQQLRVHFYNALESTKKNWLPRGNIEDVIRACVNGQCDKSDYITIDFYRYGAIHAVIALYLATKGDNNWVFAQIEALPEEWRKILIEEVKKIKINDHVPTWIRTCIRSPIRDDEETPYLNRHAPAKEKPGARRKRQRFRKTWCYGASQSPPQPIPHNSQTLPLPVASAPSFLESIQYHGDVPPHQTAPHFSQTVDIPSPGRYDAQDGRDSQQMDFNKSQDPASLTISEGTHSQDIQDHPDNLKTRNQHGRVLISNMMNPPPQKQANMSIHHQVTNEQASKRHRLGPQQIPGNMVLPGVGQYYSFSFVRRQRIENLPEPFCTGMKMSNLWRKEKESGGLAVTNCLSIYLPETDKEDAIFVVRIGYRHGFNIFNLFGFGDPGFEEGVAEDRD